MIPSLSLRYDAFDVPKVYYLCSLGMIPPLSLRYDAFDVPKVCYLQYSLCMLPAIFFGYATFRVLSCATLSMIPSMSLRYGIFNFQWV